MKYTKPKRLAAGFSDLDYSAIFAFLDSLPAEFEIVQPGMTQVRWPEGLTRDRLIYLAESRAATEGNYTNVIRTKETVARDDALKALAAIAPEEKKKRKVTLYERDDKLLGKVRVWGYKSDLDLQPGWREVGECEVTE